MEENKPGHIVFWETVQGYGSQWWTWAWLASATVLILSGVLGLQILGWILVVTYLVFFALGLHIGYNLNQVDPTLFDPPESVLEEARQSALRPEDRYPKE